MKKCFFKILSLISVLFFVFSCSDIYSGGENGNESTKTAVKTVTFTGTLETGDAVPAEIAQLLLGASIDSSERTAIPTIPTGVTYYAKATAEGRDAIEVDDSEFSADKKTFSISLEVGPLWTIEVGLKSGTETILKDSVQKQLSELDTIFNYRFFLSPDSEGVGDIDLDISVDSVVTVGLLQISLADSEQAAKWNTATVNTVSPSKIKLSNLPCGTYDVDLVFYSGATTSSPIIFSTAQSITVFSKMTTSSWVYSGDSIITDTNTFSITQELVAAFARTQFYVGGTDVNGKAATDNNSGSPYAPFASVSKAVSTICALGGNKDFIIRINGKVTDSNIQINPLSGTVNSITLCSLNGSNETDYIDGNGSTNSIITVANTKLIIKNIKITKGGRNQASNTPAKGGAINIASTGTVILESGTVITQNYSNNGGGIYNEGTLEAKSGVIISSNAATTNGSDTGNGGGIYNKGTVRLDGAKLISNSAPCGGGLANLSGGAAFIYGNTFIGGTGADEGNHARTSVIENDIGQGGGIYNSGYKGSYEGSCLYIGYKDANDDGTPKTIASFIGGIYNNTASKSGGGIDVSSFAKVYMASGTISGNSVTYSGTQVGGGGVHVEYGSFIISGGTVSGNLIAEGCTQAHGGAFSLDTLATLSLSGTADIPGNGQVNGNDVYYMFSNPIEVDSSFNPPSKNVYVSLMDRNPGPVNEEIITNSAPSVVSAKKLFFTIIPENSGYGVSSEGKIVKVVYVSSGTSSSLAAGDDTNGDGTKSKPYATVGKALSDNPGLIFVSGVTDEGSNSYTLSSTIVIESFSGEPYIKRTADAAAPLFKIASGANVTLKSIVLDGSSKNCSANGGAFYVTTSSSLKLESCKVQSFYAQKGGGICIDSGSVSINGGSLSSCKATSGDGGGICISGGSVTLDGTSMSYCTATGNGGGVYHGGSSFTLKNGANIYDSYTYDRAVYLPSGKQITQDSFTGKCSVISAGGSGTQITGSNSDNLKHFSIKPNGSKPCYITKDGKIAEISFTKDNLKGYYASYPTRTGIEHRNDYAGYGALDIVNTGSFQANWDDAYNGKTYTGLTFGVKNSITGTAVTITVSGKYNGNPSTVWDIWY